MNYFTTEKRHRVAKYTRQVKKVGKGTVHTSQRPKRLELILVSLPHVEYASSVWDPHLKKHVKQIEGVQRRAARFVKNCYTREPGTVTNLLNELNWIPLKERRTISRLTLFHKAIHGDGGLAFPDYVTKRRRHLRNSSQNKFIELLPNTETYKNSYFCRTVKDWNALPSEIVNIKSADRFKKVLFEYFSQ